MDFRRPVKLIYLRRADKHFKSCKNIILHQKLVVESPPLDSPEQSAGDG